jgi:hypothetical protein
MKIQIQWGPQRNVLTMEATESELSRAANFVAETCESRGSDLVAVEATDCPLVRRMFVDHLSHKRFSLVELTDEEKNVVGLHLLYKRGGWTLGPCAENNWGRDGEGT